MGKIKVSSAPQIEENNIISDKMLDIIIALMPVALAGVIHFGRRALAIMIISVVCCWGIDLLCKKIFRKKSEKNYSIIVTGLLLSLMLPVNIPYYVIVLGAIVTVGIAKNLLGKFGCNFLNPVLLGRAVLFLLFPKAMSTFSVGSMEIFESASDAVVRATPLSPEYSFKAPAIAEQFFGNYANGAPIVGYIGETCAVAILIGFVYLALRKVINVRIPCFYIGTVLLMYLVGGNGVNPFAGVLSGGVLFGAIFMATDYFTAPRSPLGQVALGIGCGIITCAIRFWSGYPEGVTHAILHMNIVTPLIEKYSFKKTSNETTESDADADCEMSEENE